MGAESFCLSTVAQNDTPLSLAGMYKPLERIKASRHLVIPRRADHEHFGYLVLQCHFSCRP